MNTLIFTKTLKLHLKANKVWQKIKVMFAFWPLSLKILTQKQIC